MDDGVIKAIKERGGDVSFDWFRESFKADKNLKNNLNYGHAVIDTSAKLDQYLYTYGPMIQSQWECVADLLPTIGNPDRLIDYGCGQGLAGLLLSDLTQGALLADVNAVALIEPSAIALARACAIYEALLPAANVKGIARLFDDLSAADLPWKDGGGRTLHLFSNSLDVRGFEPLDLLAKTLKPGHHTILSVSHDRDFNGGTPQIEAVKAAIEGGSKLKGIRIVRSILERFTCTSGQRSAGVAWLCELEVDGR